MRLKKKKDKAVSQSCLTLCDPKTVACQSPLSMGLQARMLEWVAAGVQLQLIQGIRRRDGIGEGQETTA